MKIKTSEATPLQLDWLVAKCEGDWILDTASFVPHHHLGRMNFSTDWSQGGPIIEREMREHGFDLWCPRGQGMHFATYERGIPDSYVAGQTPLIAAMRAFVASKLGDVVEIPEELL